MSNSQNYKLYVSCSNNGVTLDSGLQDEGKFESDETAIAYFQSPDRYPILRGGYDRIQFTLMCGDRELERWNWERPLRPRRVIPFLEFP